MRRDPSWRAGNVLRGTRRQILEAALVEERTSLWRDLFNLVNDMCEYEDPAIASIVRRIRRACEALGYVSGPDSIPVPMLRWYEMVETIHPLGLVARSVDFEVDEGEVWEVPRETWAFLRWDRDQHLLDLFTDEEDDRWNP